MVEDNATSWPPETTPEAAAPEIAAPDDASDSSEGSSAAPATPRVPAVSSRMEARSSSKVGAGGAGSSSGLASSAISSRGRACGKGSQIIATDPPASLSAMGLALLTPAAMAVSVVRITRSALALTVGAVQRAIPARRKRFQSPTAVVLKPRCGSSTSRSRTLPSEVVSW